MTQDYLKEIDANEELRILFSGGIESALLMGEATESDLDPVPVYISTGTRWEIAELSAAVIYLDALRSGLSRSLVVVRSEPSELNEHWAYGGAAYPKAGSDVNELRIPGRNRMLLIEGANMEIGSVPLSLVIGTTADNPFEDGKPDYFAEIEKKLSSRLRRSVRVFAPLLSLGKKEVIKRGARFPLHLTLSCIAPVHGKACGMCIKCAARESAFKEAGYNIKIESKEIDGY